jgi:hypothetical protein
MGGKASQTKMHDGPAFSWELDVLLQRMAASQEACLFFARSRVREVTSDRF